MQLWRCETLSMTPKEMKDRTKAFALRIIRLTEAVPQLQSGRVIAGQLLRAGTSVGANYRAACRGRSTAEFISKMGIVEEEVDETIYWMELLVASDLVKESTIHALRTEAEEILAITVSSINTARGAPRGTSRPQRIRNPKSEIRNGPTHGRPQ
jgi:four helix bundle protein